jgi:hypothetical protein
VEAVGGRCTSIWADWNATRLAQMVQVGTPVEVVE